MSESVLVIDTPKDCCTCPLLNSCDECIMLDDDVNFSVDNLDDLFTNYCPLVTAEDYEKMLKRRILEYVRKHFELS